MNISYNDLYNINIFDNDIISKNKGTTIYRFVNKYNINSIGFFLEFIENNQDFIRVSSEIIGLYNLVKFKYLEVVNEDFLYNLNSQLDSSDIVYEYKYYESENNEKLKKAGFTFDERFLFNMLLRRDKNYRRLSIIEIIEKVVRENIKMGYIGEYLQYIFYNKLNLILKYYFIKDSSILLKENNIKSLKSLLENLSNDKKSFMLLKENIIGLEDFYKSFKNDIDDIDNTFNCLIKKTNIFLENSNTDIKNELKKINK